MKKRSKLLAAMLAACMVVTTISTMAFAEEGDTEGTAVAQIGETTYTSLSEAVDAAQTNSTITLLQNITQETGVTISTNDNFTLELNGKTLTVNNNNWALLNNGTLTVQDSADGGKIVSTGGNGMFVGNNSTTTIKSGTFESVEGAVATSKSTGATITIDGGTFKASDNAVIAGNGSSREGSPNNITINDGTFEGGITSSGYVACGIYAPWKDNIIVNGGTFNITGGAGIVARAGTVTVNGGTFNTTGNETGKVGDSRIVVHCAALVFDQEANYPGMDNNSKISVSDGQFTSDVNAIATVGDDSTSRVSISAGYFTSDPSAYLAEGKAAVASDKTGYVYMVDVASDNKAEVAPAAPAVDTKEGVDETAATAIAGALASTGEDATPPSITADVVNAAANTIANDNKTTKDEGKDALEHANVIVKEGDTVTIVIQPYLDIQIVDAEVTSGENSTITSFTLDITPMYKTVATTANLASNGEIITETTEDSGKTVNAVVMGDPAPLTIDQSVTVTVPLPADFATNNVYVQHKGHEYTATVDSDVATFTNPHGFSEFTFTTVSTAVAKIGEDSYTTLQAAVDAIENNGTITVLTANALEATASGNKTFTIAGGEDITPSVTIKAAAGYTVVPGEDGNYTVKKNSSTGGGGSTTPTEPTDPTEPDDETCKKDSTCPISKFTDASAAAWYHDGVHYVLENSLMFGTGNNKFSPNATLTRAELAQILYNKAGKPAVNGASTFTDVPASAWYAKAVAWAQQNNVVSGVGGGKFAPNDKITREQIAVMLYNDAGKKAVTGTLNFKDAANVSNWAKDAMLWATQNKVVNGAVQSDGTLLLNPTNGATRAETAAMLANYYNK